MDRLIAEQVFVACEKTIASLTEAEHAIGKIADEAERSRLLRALTGVIVDVLSNVRAPVVLQYPDLEPPPEQGPPDTNLTEEAQELLSTLSLSDLELIDAALLSECVHTWRKVARVVGTTMSSLRHQFPGIPDSFYAQRVVELVRAGALESQGNLEYMRFSEVRRPGVQPGEA